MISNSSEDEAGGFASFRNAGTVSFSAAPSLQHPSAGDSLVQSMCAEPNVPQMLQLERSLDHDECRANAFFTKSWACRDMLQRIDARQTATQPVT